MKPSVISAEDRAELNRLLGSRASPAFDDLDSELIALLAAQKPQAIFEAEALLRHVRNTSRQAASGFFSRRDDKSEPVPTPLLVFSMNGFVREAALKAITTLPAAPFFVAALAWRMNDWVVPVRRAAEDCARRCFPQISAQIIVSTAPFLLERLPFWGRWDGPPDILLGTLARSDCSAELATRLAQTADIPAIVVRSALRFGVLDTQLASLSSIARRPEHRAAILKALLDGHATWVSGYERQWIDKRYGITRRVPVLCRRRLDLAVSVAELITQGASDRSPFVRSAAASGLVQNAASLSEATDLTALFQRDKTRSVQWCLEYLSRQS